MTTNNQDIESVFRFGLHTLAFIPNEAETLQAAWERIARANNLDASRAVTFKQAGQTLEGNLDAKIGQVYSVTVSLSKNGSEDEEAVFRFGLHTLPFTVIDGESLQQAWERVARNNSLDASRAMTFKHAGETIPGDEDAIAGEVYSATVSLSKNG